MGYLWRPFCLIVVLVFGVLWITQRSADAQWAAVEGAAPPISPKTAGPILTTLHDTPLAPLPVTITLAPATSTEKSVLQANTPNQPLQVGFGRGIPAAYQGNLRSLLPWTTLTDGRLAATFAITSPQASALRVALAAPSLAEGSQIRFFSLDNPDQIFGPFTNKDFLSQAGREPQTQKNSDTPAEAAPFWSPVIEGDTIGAEIVLPAAEALAAFSVHLVQVSHLVYSVGHSQAKRLSDIGRSGSCNIDVQCRTTVPDNLEAATAKIVYTRNGNSFLCTGTLLNDNDSDTFIPYLMTANHCFSEQQPASSVNTFWFFERATCEGPEPTAVTQFVGGADLLTTGQTTDFTFLQLNDSAISSLSGIWFAGWDSEPVMNASSVVGIHHPRGDLKKWSEGSVTGSAANPLLAVPPDPASHTRIIWSQGTTEPGSSGSGIFDPNGNFRGNLSGGLASCSALSEPDFYGRFDKTFPSVERWLSFVPPPLDTSSPLAGSVQQGEWVEYKLTTTATDAQLVFSLGGLSQDADLYVRRGSRPSPQSFDCRPFSSGSSAETCTLANTGAQVYYIGVRGFAPGTTTFTLQSSVSQGVLENPQPNSFQSGIGVISGWICDASIVEIEFDGGPPFEAAYGTSRNDTQSICGDTDNGFGLLFNWNLLGDGVHTVRALADGVAFANVTITVTTLGLGEFPTGLSGAYALPNFPQAGPQTNIQWQQSQQNFVIVSGSASGGGSSGSGGRVLENPQPGSFQSGIGVISGFVCNASLIEISFDNGTPFEAAYGTSRSDTATVCGDANNGFSLLFNWNLLGDGVHTVRALADGVEFASVTIRVTTLGLGEFPTGLSGAYVLPNFPQAGTQTSIQWQQSQQNFVIVGVQ